MTKEKETEIMGDRTQRICDRELWLWQNPSGASHICDRTDDWGGV